MRILVAYRAIDGIAGGLERMSNALMNEMSARGHDVHFVTLDNKNAASYYPLNENIKWHKVNIGDYRVKASIDIKFKRQKKIYKLIKSVKPDLILAFQDGAFFNNWMPATFNKVPIVLCERISPQHFDYTSYGNRKNLLWQLYRLASKITIQCKSYVDMYPKHLQKKLVTIPNPVFQSDDFAMPEGQKEQDKILLFVGRLSYQKHPEILIKAFEELQDRHPNWQLHIAGSGEKEDELRRLSKNSESIYFLGNIRDIKQIYINSHLLCIPSRWEGFPNALAEALAHGLPCVGFNTCGGVRDLIHNEYNGLLCSDDLESLKLALSTLMSNDKLRKEYGRNAVESVKQYESSIVFDQWEEFIESFRKT